MLVNLRRIASSGEIGHRQHNAWNEQQPQHQGSKLLIVHPAVRADTQKGSENGGRDTHENQSPNFPRHSALCDIGAEHDRENDQI